MKTNDKIFETIVGIVFFFVFNLGISTLCMLFLDLKFTECLFYSLINATWMPIISPALLSKIKSIEYRKIVNN